MFTSGNINRNLLKQAAGHLAAAMFLAFFGAVYEHFSHGVYSYFMIYAFAFPLTLGAFLFLCLALSNKRLPSNFSLKTWNCGIAALSVGSVVKGVLDIYGTTNRLISVYPIAGISLLFIGLAAWLKSSPPQPEE